MIVTGLVTHGCVKATSQGALALGYEVTLVADGHSSYSKDAARLIEEWNRSLGAAGAQVLLAAEVDLTPHTSTAGAGNPHAPIDHVFSPAAGP